MVACAIKEQELVTSLETEKEKLHNDLVEAKRKHVATIVELSDWKNALQSVAPGSVPTATAAHTAIRELRENELNARKYAEQLRVELEAYKRAEREASQLSGTMMVPKFKLDELQTKLEEAQRVADYYHDQISQIAIRKV